MVERSLVLSGSLQRPIASNNMASRASLRFFNYREHNYVVKIHIDWAYQKLISILYTYIFLSGHSISDIVGASPALLSTGISRWGKSIQM